MTIVERMVQVLAGRWVYAEVEADRAGRGFDPIMDGHIMHTAAELAGDGWTPDGTDWIREWHL